MPGKAAAVLILTLIATSLAIATRTSKPPVLSVNEKIDELLSSGSIEDLTDVGDVLLGLQDNLDAMHQVTRLSSTGFSVRDDFARNLGRWRVVEQELNQQIAEQMRNDEAKQARARDGHEVLAPQ